MQKYATAKRESSTDYLTPADIIAEHRDEAVRELDDFKKVASAFLRAARGNRKKAKELFELVLDRVLDCNVLSPRAHREILKAIGE